MRRGGETVGDGGRTQASGEVLAATIRKHRFESECGRPLLADCSALLSIDHVLSTISVLDGLPDVLDVPDDG